MSGFGLFFGRVLFFLRMMGIGVHTNRIGGYFYEKKPQKDDEMRVKSEDGDGHVGES